MHSILRDIAKINTNVLSKRKVARIFLTLFKSKNYTIFCLAGKNEGSPRMDTVVIPEQVMPNQGHDRVPSWYRSRSCILGLDHVFFIPLPAL